MRSWNAYPGAGPIVDPDDLAELRRAHHETKRDLQQLKRDIAWNRVIDDAIHLCRVLCKAELAELDAKYRADQPRVPAGNPDGGQWVDEGGGGGRAGVAGTAPGATIEIGDAARVAAQAAAKLRQLLQAGGQIVTAAGAGTSALAVGILMATADPTGGTRQEQTQTLADGTVVTVSSNPGDTPDRTIRAESPDGTVTYATISIGKAGSVKVLGGEVQSPGGGRQPIDPNAFAAAAGALINAATSGGGGKPKARHARQERPRRDAAAG